MVYPRMEEILMLKRMFIPDGLENFAEIWQVDGESSANSISLDTQLDLDQSGKRIYSEKDFKLPGDQFGTFAGVENSMFAYFLEKQVELSAE